MKIFIIIFHYSYIPLFLFLISCLILSGCAGTERFGKNDSEINKNVLGISEGIASYYADEYHGRKTANGETYDMYALTAAHKTYPFNTKVRVTNLSNSKSVILRINDRMPVYNKRLIDISFQAAKELNMIVKGITEVKIEVLEWGDD